MVRVQQEITVSDSEPNPYGFDDKQLAAQPTVFRSDLFAGKVVAVSGAGSGLGRAIAALFARLGADLAICGRDADKLADAATFFEGLGAHVHQGVMTIRDAGQVETFIADATEALGEIDVLVNNAGGQFPQAALDFSVKGWNAVIDTNLNGTWYMMQAMARRWVETSRPGVIVNIVAVVSRGLPGIAHTCAARAGVIHLSKTVAIEWAPHNIRVNCVAPGCCETSAFALYPEEGAATYEEANPMKQSGDAQDIAEATVYMAAPSAKFVTGELLNVDGGQQLWGDPWPTGRPDYFRIG
jgi:citronellol/citronellal dehydrogenase